MAIINVGGLDTYYNVYGNGSPIVLIHHLAGNTNSWYNQISYFAKKYKVIAYDLRGHGKSAEPKEGFSLEDLAQDLYLLLKKLGIERCSVIGHSIGGMIAPLFALRHEAMVSSLIIVAGASQALASDKLASYSLMREIAKTKGMEALAEYRRANNQIPPKIANVPSLWEHFKQLYRETSVQGYIKTSEALTTMPNITEKLKHLSCPMLGIVGDLDPVFMEMMKILADNTKLTLKLMHNCGHFVMMEEPNEFNDTVSNFLKSYNLK